jgi:hypothetical protein
VSLCVAESERLEVPEVITADFVYYRLRKPDYTEADVDAFAVAFVGVAVRAVAVHVHRGGMRRRSA